MGQFREFPRRVGHVVAHRAKKFFDSLQSRVISIADARPEERNCAS